jgi:hypothetical protein
MTPKEFETALNTKPVGGQVVYYSGSLMFDRIVGANRPAVKAIAAAAWAAYEAGQCTLVQRHKPFGSDYIAVKVERHRGKPSHQPILLRR